MLRVVLVVDETERNHAVCCYIDTSAKFMRERATFKASQKAKKINLT